jgi:Redoxin
MRSLISRVGVVVIALASFGAAPGQGPAIGDRVTDAEFKDVRSLRRSLDDFGARKAYVLVAVRTTCPLALRYMPVLAEMEKTYRAQGVQFLAIGVSSDETVAELAAMAIDAGAEFPIGKDDGSWTRALGWKRTPEAVVLDGDRRLRYRGRIDDQIRIGGAKPAASHRDLANAIEAVLAGRAVETAETPVDGCAIPVEAVPDKPAGPVPTFHEQVEPILQKRCQNCHRPNTETPFALLSYRDAVMQAETIAEVVEDRRMPPWYAVHDQEIINKRVLDDSERETLLRWVKGGTPKGDPAKRPEPLKFPTAAYRIGTPDKIITMLGTSEIPATGFVDYRYILFPYVFLDDTWVQSVEIHPDNPRVIHHANLAYVKGGEKFSDENFITGRVPGGDPMSLDDGLAYLIPAGSVLAMQVHYTTTGKPERCKISVGFKYPRTPVHKRLYHTEVTTHRFTIPPNAPAHKLAARRTLPFDASLLGVVAHMHVRATDMDFRTQKPDGTSERLLLVPNYNFDWQMSYRWELGTKKLAKGTVMEAIGRFDNSSFNPFNPNPSAAVKFGEQTFQEMVIGYYFYTRDDEDLGLSIDARTGHVLARPVQSR